MMRVSNFRCKANKWWLCGASSSAPCSVNITLVWCLGLQRHYLANLNVKLLNQIISGGCAFVRDIDEQKPPSILN